MKLDGGAQSSWENFDICAGKPSFEGGLPTRIAKVVFITRKPSKTHLKGLSNSGVWCVVDVTEVVWFMEEVGSLLVGPDLALMAVD